MNKFLIPAIALAMVFSTSAFKSHKTAGVFYEYRSSLTTQAAIQNPNNYIRSEENACEGSSDVCGVLLTTDTGANHTPNVTEFNAEKTNLWTSQQNSAPADGNIAMKD